MDIVLDVKSVVYFAGVDAARFQSAPVEPGDQLVLDVTWARQGGHLQFAARGLVGDRVVAEAELMCTVVWKADLGRWPRFIHCHR